MAISFYPKSFSLVPCSPLQSICSSRFYTGFYIPRRSETKLLTCNPQTSPSGIRRRRNRFSKLKFQIHSCQIFIRASFEEQSVIVTAVITSFLVLHILYNNLVHSKKSSTSKRPGANAHISNQDGETVMGPGLHFYNGASWMEKNGSTFDFNCLESEELTKVQQQIAFADLPIDKNFDSTCSPDSVYIPFLLTPSSKENTNSCSSNAYSTSQLIDEEVSFPSAIEEKKEATCFGAAVLIPSTSGHNDQVGEFKCPMSGVDEHVSWPNTSEEYKTAGFGTYSQLPDGNNSFMLRSNDGNGATQSTKEFCSTGINFLVAKYKGRSLSIGGKNIKNRCFLGDNKRQHTPQNARENFFSLVQRNAVDVKGNNNHLVGTYNRLLRDGRITECNDFLESMKRKGLLDMDNIYHAKFLNACRRQRTVKEAFRFVRQIKNPSLSTFNMLLSVCANSLDFEGAFQVLSFVKDMGLKADCKLYTTLISTCAKCGKVDAMFEVFHEMVNAGINPNTKTYGALIDGCARAGQVAKAFGAYGIMRSKNVKPDRIIFNALITACGQSGAVDRAFDVLAEMRSEPYPIEPDHVTIGALMKTCIQAGQVEKAREVYKMIYQYKIKGTPEVYTIAVSSCCKHGHVEFALGIYADMQRNGVIPDEMFLSTLIDVAGHAGMAELAFEIIRDARSQGLQLGNISYSSLMGAYSKAKDWEKALELYEELKSINLVPRVSIMNALITSLCNGNQLQKSVEVFKEMKEAGILPNCITYCILLVACEKNDALDLGLDLLSKAKKDGVDLTDTMFRCLMGICLRKFENACSRGEPILSPEPGKLQIENEWTSQALILYREMIAEDTIPSIELFSQVLGCLQLPRENSLRSRLIENLKINTSTSSSSSLYSFLDGFGEYDPRSFSLFEEAASLGIVPYVSLKQSLIVVDVKQLQIHISEVYLLTVLKGLKHRLAAGAKLPNITILLPTDKTLVKTSKGERVVNLSGRVGQAVGALLRRLGLHFQGNESYGKIRITGLTLKRWLQPKLIPSSFSNKNSTELSLVPARLAKGIMDQQRSIRTSNFFIE